MAPNELATLVEVAAILRVPKSSAARYVDRPDFPEPIATLAVGRIWRADDVARWGRDHLPLRRGRRPAE